MQTAAMTSRFLTGCSSSLGLADSEIVVSHGGLLRHIVAWHLAQTVQSQELFVKLTNDLIRFADQAYVMRDVDALDEVSHVLMNLPVDAARQIGSYYYALALNRQGKRDEAEARLQGIADDAPATYRARAIQTLGGNYHDKGQLDEALRFQLEALRLASDRTARGLETTVRALGEISAIKSLDGDHRGALCDLENLRPLVNLAAKQQPFHFYAYCNDLAVELGELDRIPEAHSVLKAALASPFAGVHPNWTETRDEIAAKRVTATPSVVAVKRAPETDASPELEHELKRVPSRAPASPSPAHPKHSCQRAIIPNTATAATPHDGITQGILNRVLTCIGSRAPPVRS
ncbi:MAG: tetratricopeptide repeat protein [Acidobacteriota bacterium]